MMRILLFLLCVTCMVMAQEPAAPEAIPEGVKVSVNEETSDDAIKQRLSEIFSELEGLNRIEVTVQHGVVTLSGLVPNAQSAEEAAVLTDATDGVIYVRDQLEEDVEVESRLKPAFAKAKELGRATIRKLPLIGISLLIILVFWLLGRWLSRRDWIFKKLGLTELSGGLIRRLVRIVFIVAGIAIALEILDATALAGAIVGVAGVVGIAFGFAFRNIIENYLAGILLSMRNPFESGDAVEVDGSLGKVVRLTSRDTVLMTLDGNHLRIPNSLIMTSKMTNFSRNPLRQFNFAVGVSCEQDLVAVREIGLETMLKVDAVLEDPAPKVLIEALGDSTVNMKFFAWIDQKESDFLKSKSEAIRLVKEKFDELGIEMPEPIYRVMMTNKDAVEPKSEGPKRKSTGDMDTRNDGDHDEQVAAAQREDEEDLLTEK